MTINVKEITAHLNKLLYFLESARPLANSHFGSFFSKNSWNKHLPSVIQCELNNLSSIKDFILLYPKIINNDCPNNFAESHPNLIKFINTAMSLSISRNEKYLKLLKDLEKLLSTGNICKSSIEIKCNMSEKKIHEVKVTSKMTAFVSHLTSSSHIVDVGGGKGYLSCLLALYYSFKVLGLDSSEVTICGASKISTTFATLWNGEVLECPGDLHLKKIFCDKKARLDFVKQHYKQAVTFVNSDTNIEDLLKESFDEEVTGITLTGLHTCGDLASNCLRMFLRSKKAQGLINVGCCYNLLNEEFAADHIEESSKKDYGFPMSNFLRNQEFVLGDNVRILAAHSPDRVNSESDLKFSVTSIFYRAILETIRLQTNSTSDHGQVGKLAKKCKNFHEYMLKGLKKLGIDAEVSSMTKLEIVNYMQHANQFPIQFTENDLDKLYKDYSEKKPFLTAFFLIRITLAPVVESIILLDRILYLAENGINNVYLVPLFNLKLSPRGFGIIAWKDDPKNRLFL